MAKYGIFISRYGDQIVQMWCDAGKDGLPKAPYKDFGAADFARRLYQDRNPKGFYEVRQLPEPKKNV